MKVTVLHGVYKIQSPPQELHELAEEIKNGVHVAATFECRKGKHALSKARYQQLKANTLKCFTPSGRFGQQWTKRKSDGMKIPIPPKKEALIEYNGNVVLDYDGITDYFELEELIQKVQDCPHTLLSFLSPSGEGIKVIVKTSNSDPLQHPNAYKVVSAYYQDLTGIESDKSSKNINRLCFVSSDPHLYYNEESTAFVYQTQLFETVQVEKQQKTQAKTAQSIDYDSFDDITKAINKIESKGFSYVEGQRHEYVKQFSIECVKYGIEQKECQDFVEGNLLQADQDERKAFKLIQWAYDNIKEVGIYDTWRKENGKEGKSTQSSTNEYEPNLYKEKATEEQSINLPELDEEEINELDKKIRASMFMRQKVEDTLKQFFDFRINTLKSREEYRPKGKGKFVAMEKKEYNSIAGELLKKRGLRCSPAVLEGIILSQFSKDVHPLKESLKGWGDSLENDTTDYIEKVAALVKTDAPKDLFKSVFKKWLVASVANVFIEGHCTNHHCLILCGEQGTNKTTFFTSLFSAEYTFTGHLDLKNKDSMILLSDTFIVVLDEQFSVLSKDSEWEALKSAVTMPRIKARKHYAKNSTLAPRIANFCGTANRIEILQDDTGNRRFLPFKLIAPIDINELQNIDMRKLWGQAYKLYKQGWRYLPDLKEKSQIDKYQNGFKKLSNEHYFIMELYEPCSKQDKDLELLNATDIWKHLDKSFTLSKDVSVSKVARAMGFLGFQQKTVAPEGRKRGRYWCVKRL
ncbi:VapE domain-containing protein [Aureispira sp. CCB-QB1]|uniref:VapE domain-containing protein n=1 Tax=Aureispira sp. CCB-QB1 TaxID=1313421 RepID=UPI0006984652|nr:VapE domain-containing protein [Aureispira sp. CCB-QB1]